MEVTARAIRQMPLVKPLVEMCSKAVGWQRALYRTKLLSVPGKVVMTAVMTVGVRHVIRHIT